MNIDIINARETTVSFDRVPILICRTYILYYTPMLLKTVLQLYNIYKYKPNSCNILIVLYVRI